MGTRITTLTVFGITAGVAIGFSRESQGQTQPPDSAQAQVQIQSRNSSQSPPRASNSNPSATAGPALDNAAKPASASAINPAPISNPGANAQVPTNRPILAAPASDYLRAAARLYNVGQYWKSSKYLRVAYDYQDKLTPDERVMLDVYLKALQQVPRELRETPPAEGSRLAAASSGIGIGIGTANPNPNPNPAARPGPMPGRSAPAVAFDASGKIRTASAAPTQDPNAGPASAIAPKPAQPPGLASGIFVPPLEQTPEGSNPAAKKTASAPDAKPAKPSEPTGSDVKPAPGGVVFEPLPAMQGQGHSEPNPSAPPAALAPGALGIISPDAKVPDPSADPKEQAELAKSPADHGAAASKEPEKAKEGEASEPAPFSISPSPSPLPAPSPTPAPSAPPTTAPATASAAPNEADIAGQFPPPELEEPREIAASGLAPPSAERTPPPFANANAAPAHIALNPGADSVPPNGNAGAGLRSPRVDRNVAPTRISSIDMTTPRHQRELGMLNPNANRTNSPANQVPIGEAGGGPIPPLPNVSTPGSEKFPDFAPPSTIPPSVSTSQPVVPNFAPNLNDPRQTARRPVVDALKSFGVKVRDLISPEARRANAMIAANAGKQALCHSPDGSILAGSTGANGEITLWNTASRQAVMTLPGSGRSRAAGPCLLIAFSPDGRQLIGVTPQGVLVHDLASRGRNSWELQTKASAIGFSPDGSVLSINTMSGETVYCKATNGQVLGSLTTNFQMPPQPSAALPMQDPNSPPQGQGMGMGIGPGAAALPR